MGHNFYDYFFLFKSTETLIMALIKMVLSEHDRIDVKNLGK